MTLLLLAALSVAVIDLSHPLSDYFHEGEYLGLVPHMLAYYAGEAGFPLMIHGAMDYAPGLMSNALQGYDRIIIGTRLINTLVACVDLAIFLLIINELLLRARRTWLCRLGVAVSSSFLLLFPAGDAVSLHLSIVGSRELFLLLILFLLLKQDEQNPPSTELARASLIGAAAAISPFWAYDRGLVALLAFGLIGIGLLLSGRTLHFSIATISFTVTLVLCDLTGIFGTIAENSTNIRYWIRNASMWNYPWTPGLVLDAVLLLCLDVGVGISVVKIVLARWRSGSQPFALFAAVLVAIQFLLLPSALNRPDGTHLFRALWPTLLGMITVYAEHYRFDVTVSLLAAREGGANTLNSRFYRLSTMALVTVCLVLWARSLRLVSLPRGIVADQTNDSVINDDDLTRAVDMYKSLSPGCVMTWSNVGVIPILARLPYCSDVSYPVFVSRSREMRYLEQLKSAPPSSIVYSPTFWAFEIDGKSMPTRLPRVEEYIEKSYELKARFGEWIVLQRVTADH